MKDLSDGPAGPTAGVELAYMSELLGKARLTSLCSTWTGGYKT